MIYLEGWDWSSENDHESGCCCTFLRMETKLQPISSKNDTST